MQHKGGPLKKRTTEAEGGGPISSQRGSDKDLAAPPQLFFSEGNSRVTDPG